MNKQQQSVAILLENVSKTFPDRSGDGEVHAVRPLDLEISPGKFTTLLGPSGCGKTTLLRIVAGFEEPTTGKIIIGGLDQTAVMANKRNIGFVFQNYALFPHMTVFENVSYGLKLKGVPKNQINKDVSDVLDMVGLSGLERRFPNQLSGGEQQRVALARVVVTKPRVLLFDEPLSNLDAKRRIQMRMEIKELQKMLSITSLYVTHDQEEALAISDDIVVMNKGTIEQVGTPQEIYSRPQTKYVAQFVGNTNVFPVTVKAIRGTEVDVEAEIGGHTFRAQATSAGLKAGSKAFALIRPEAISIEKSQDNGAAIKGKVKHATYLGEKAEYDLDVYGQELKVVVPDPHYKTAFEPGEEVTINFADNRISVVDH